MKIILHDNSLTERGTSVALYDYALSLREKHHVEIAYNLEFHSNAEIIEKFSRNFRVNSYNNFSELENYIDKHCFDILYTIKYGTIDNVVSKNCINAVHSVFSNDKYSVHGERYAVVSEWMSTKSGIDFVPHMIRKNYTEENLREKFNIPEKSIVFGRYGGYDTFNIDFVVEEILDFLNRNLNVWFLFMNTEKRIEHERCIYLSCSSVSNLKKKFINTCDAMIHARDYGETFGLSVLEFAAAGKQIISYDNFNLQNLHPLGGRNHFLFLKENCHKYTDRNSLRDIFNNIQKENPFDTKYLNDMFSPNKVMQKFEKIFL